MKNAVEKRLGWLHNQWVEFAQAPEARLLRWLVEPSEARMVEAWLKKEGDERTGECPDLFLRFDIPFVQPEAYGLELREMLVAMVAESQEEVDLGRVAPGQSGAEVFFSACEALQRHYASVCEVLAVVLVPGQVSEVKAWRQWLQKALASPHSPKVRVVVLDDVRVRVLEPLAQAEPTRIKTMVADLDMPGAMEEVARGAAGMDPAGGRYRELLVRLGAAAGRGELHQVTRLGEEAVALAAGQGWSALVVAARWAMGAALLVASKPTEALEHYRKAEAVAMEAETRGEAQGAELRLKSRMAMGAVLVTRQEWAEAAVLYEETAPLARKLADARLELECWRMASFCRESIQEMDKAWESSEQAWSLGLALEPEARASSTLPYVAEARVRLGRARQGEAAARRLESEAESLLGNDWRPDVQAAGGQAA
ncbi:MAG TPA: hypothetical protein VFZ09_44805 [Archangium sp.]|uniref:hypothetical protein n=1 Tax=Archangium sp. TaxID=1872627 RepID=UPI002E3431FA|nr:hypothetical protein [Archangium sp.]HEX5753402.1 hypothetical protein [Archangium sp.]